MDTSRRGLRPLPNFSDLLRLLLLLVIMVFGLIGATQLPGAIGDRVGQVLSSLNPFDRPPANRTGPAVLHELTELKEFKAAAGYYEVVVDVEAGGSFPSWVDGDRVIYVGKGKVDALVDFGELDERRVVPSEDGTSVTVTLPAPTLDEPVLDIRKSEVVFHDEGFLTKWNGSDLERKAQLQALDKLKIAANGETKLPDMAKVSTTAMLKGFFRAVGYDDVTVKFEESLRSRS